MQVEGKHPIPIKRENLWDAINDPDVLKACIPGCESFDAIDESNYATSIVASVGPIRAKFSAIVTLSDIKPPHSYKLCGEGKGGATGFANGEVFVNLDEDGDNTVLSYRAEIKLGGKLAQVGSRLIQGASQKLSEQFVSNLVKRFDVT